MNIRTLTCISLRAAGMAAAVAEAQSELQLAGAQGGGESEEARGESEQARLEDAAQQCERLQKLLERSLRLQTDGACAYTHIYTYILYILYICIHVYTLVYLYRRGCTVRAGEARMLSIVTALAHALILPSSAPISAAGIKNKKKIKIKIQIKKSNVSYTDISSVYILYEYMYVYTYVYVLSVCMYV